MTSLPLRSQRRWSGPGTTIPANLRAGCGTLTTVDVVLAETRARSTCVLDTSYRLGSTLTSMTTRSVLAAQRRHNYPLSTLLEVHACAECGIIHGIPKDFLDYRRQDGQPFYCPNGHSLSYHETEEDRQRKRAQAAERRAAAATDTADRWRANAETERRSAIAYKGHLTRARKRIANGVCPVPGCKRSGFDRVMAHIASQHADWLHQHPEVQKP